MVTRKLFFFLFICFFAIASLANVATYRHPHKVVTKTITKKHVKKIVSKKVTVYKIQPVFSGSFDTVQADGNFDITVVYGRPSVAIDCSQPCVDAQVIDGTLMLSNFIIVDKHQRPILIKCPTANVRISLPGLDAIYLLGNSSLVANNVRSYGTIVAVNGNGSVTLNGVVNVRKISANGNGNVSIRGVKSDDLLILGNHSSEIHLEGTARVLEARLSGESFLDAKYLRPDVAFIDTRDFATVDIAATHALYAFATDDSNIYYYKTPRYNYLEHSEYSGDILQLGHWR